MAGQTCKEAHFITSKNAITPKIDRHNLLCTLYNLEGVIKEVWGFRNKTFLRSIFFQVCR